jgi:hypothetical protein
MASVEQVYLLVANELNAFLNQKVTDSYHGHTLNNIDNFLVDGRRQLRTWQREKRVIESKVKQRSDRLILRKGDLQTAKKVKNKVLIDKIKSTIDILKSEIKDLEHDKGKVTTCHDSILKGLEKLEEVAQNIRQKQNHLLSQKEQKLNDLIVDFDKINIS